MLRWYLWVSLSPITIPDDKHLHNLFREMLNLREEKEKIINARKLLQTSIKAAGGWQVLQAAMQKNNPISAGYFRNAAC